MDGPAADEKINFEGREHEYRGVWNQTVFEYSVIALLALFWLVRLLSGGGDDDLARTPTTIFVVLMLVISVPGLFKNFTYATAEDWPATSDDLRQRWTITALMSLIMGAALGWLLATVFYGDFNPGSIGLIVALAASIYTLLQVRPKEA